MDLTLTHRIRRYEDLSLEDQMQYYKDYSGWGKNCTLLKEVGFAADIVLEGETLEDAHLISRDHLVPLSEQNWLWT